MKRVGGEAGKRKGIKYRLPVINKSGDVRYSIGNRINNIVKKYVKQDIFKGEQRTSKTVLWEETPRK